MRRQMDSIGSEAFAGLELSGKALLVRTTGQRAGATTIISAPARF